MSFFGPDFFSKCTKKLVYYLSTTNLIERKKLLMLRLYSGGNGKFMVSTSLMGYTPITGTTAPMVRDGYGIFYGILNKE